MLVPAEDAQSPQSEDDRDERSCPVRDRHEASRAHDLSAHRACPLAEQPGADAVVAEEMATRELDGRPHGVLHQDSHLLLSKPANFKSVRGDASDQLSKIRKHQCS